MHTDRMNHWAVYHDQSLLLQPGDVHFWCADLSKNPMWSCELPLSDQLQIARLVQKEDQHKSRHTKIIVRHILARYINTTPEAIVFKYEQYGKPFISDSVVQFNWSHSGNCLLMAITAEKNIGVDVEKQRDRIDELALAKRFFAPEEYEMLEQLPKAQQLSAFYHCWTAKEAFIKATGLGLSFGLSRFVINFTQLRPSLLSTLHGDTTAARDWTVQSMSLPPFFSNYFASFALHGFALRYFYFELL